MRLSEEHEDDAMVAKQATQCGYETRVFSPTCGDVVDEADEDSGKGSDSAETEKNSNDRYLE